MVLIVTKYNEKSLLNNGNIPLFLNKHDLSLLLIFTKVCISQEFEHCTQVVASYHKQTFAIKLTLICASQSYPIGLICLA